MAQDATAVERAHQEIKALILSGELGVRTRLEVDALAQRLGLSSMPVRQALAMLAFERLARRTPNGGYEVALWSEPELAELYQWRGDLMVLTLPARVSGSESKRIARTQPYEQAVWAMMRALEKDASEDLKRAALSADERLQAARMVEAEVLDDIEAELENLAAAIAERGRRAKTVIASFHRRRSEKAGLLRRQAALRALPNNGGRR